jgi:hypothetical protein
MIQYKNHWMEEAKQFIKIYDNTKSVHCLATNPRYPKLKEDDEPEYFGRVRAKSHAEAISCLDFREVSEHFWYDRIDRQLHEWDEENRPLVKQFVPSEPGQ